VTIDNLLPGVYTVTEQNIPERYILDTTPQQVTLLPNRDASVQFQNYKRPTLTIAKVDINGRPLTGALFEVKTKAGVKIGDFPVGVEHDKGNTITFENIPKSAPVIRKIDADTGAPLVNAWFRIRYLGGTSIGEFNTSGNGNIIITGLEAGTYICGEINALISQNALFGNHFIH